MNFEEQFLGEFQQKCDICFEALFKGAKESDELAYIFSLLGLSSGMEDIGWQPISETILLCNDLKSFLRTPLKSETKARLSLFLYCHIIESNFVYHVLFNLLLTIEGISPPKAFNFLNLCKNGVPPSVKSKIKELSKKSETLGFSDVKNVLTEVYDNKIRNKFNHSDYIIYQGNFRLKHQTNEICEINLNEINLLLHKTLIYFHSYFNVLNLHKKSYENGHLIQGRIAKDGRNLSNITIIADPVNGISGFISSDPLPLW